MKKSLTTLLSILLLAIMLISSTPRTAEATHSGGWDGWIRLSGTWTPGVSYTKLTHTLSGYGWGSDVIGWLSFSGSWGSVGIDCSTLVPGDVLCGPTIVVSAVTTTPPPSLSYLDFGNVVISNTAQKTIYVHNRGVVSMSGTVTFSGANPSYFSCTPSCNFTNIAPNSSAPFILTYTADAAAPNVASDAVATFADGVGNTATLSVHGNSILPLSAAPVDFSTIVVTKTKDLTLTITNTSAVNFGLRTITIPNGSGFTCVTSPCQLTIPPNGSGSVIVRFTPTAVQAYTTNATLSGLPFTVPLSGKGTGKVFNVKEK